MRFLFRAFRAAPLALAAPMRAGVFRRSFPAAAETFRGHADKIVPERNAAQARSERLHIRRRLPLDPALDLFRQFLPVTSVERETAFGRIGQEPAFHQN